MEYVGAKLLHAPSRTSIMDISLESLWATASHQCGYFSNKPMLTDGIASFRERLATAVAEAVAKASHDVSVCLSVKT